MQLETLKAIEVLIEKFGFQRACNRLSNFVLELEDVLVRPVVTLRPEGGPVDSVDQLRSDPHDIFDALDAAFEQVRDAKLSADGRAVLLGVAKTERRHTPDHLQPANLRQSGD